MTYNVFGGTLNLVQLQLQLCSRAVNYKPSFLRACKYSWIVLYSLFVMWMKTVQIGISIKIVDF